MSSAVTIEQVVLLICYIHVPATPAGFHLDDALHSIQNKGLTKSTTMGVTDLHM
jgi:hypothetical protein